MTHDGIPPMAPLAPIVDEMRALADEELPQPRTCRIRLWDDGTFELVIWHGNGDERWALRYELATGEILWEYIRGYELEEEELTGGETLLTPTYEEYDARLVAQVEPPYR